jgi:hypothetical protein
MRVLAEIIASEVLLLVTFNRAIDGVIKRIEKRDLLQRLSLNWTATRGRW